MSRRPAWRARWQRFAGWPSGSRSPAEAGLLLLFFGCLLITLALAACLWLGWPYAGRARANDESAARLAFVTPSPFLPAANTRTPLVTPKRAAAWWLGLDLVDEAAPLRLLLSFGQPARMLAVDFRPGWPCEFDNHRACLSRHNDGQLLLVTVHSGVGGEAQALRDALEGTGINRAGYSLERIAANLHALRGAPVTVEQGGVRLDGLQVLAALRVPPDRLDAYYSRSFDASLAEAAAGSPALQRALAAGDPLLVLETCGWRHPAEPWFPGITDTSGAVYLVVIGE